MLTHVRFALPAALLVGLAALTPAQPDGTNKAPPAPDQLAGVVPGDATAFVSLKVSAVWDHKAFGPVREARGQVEFAWAVQALVGLPPGEIDRLTAFWHPPSPDAPFVLVTGRKPVDPAAMVKTLTRAGAAAPKPVPGGKVLVAPGAEFPYLLPVDAKTVLLAPKSSDPSGLEKLAGRAGPLGAAVESAGRHTLTVGLDVKAAKLPLPISGPLLEADTAVLTADLTGESTGKAELRLAFTTAEKAKTAAPLLKAKLDELSVWAAAQEKRVVERGQEGTSYPAPLLDWIAKTLKAVKVRTDGKAVVATADVKLDEMVSRLVSAAPDAALAPRGSSAAENNMKQILLGVISYSDANNRMPSNSYDKDGKPLLSWRVQILPYIEQSNVYQQFKLDEPWDSDNNKPLSQIVVKVFQVPGRPAGQPWETYFRAFVGPKGVKPEHRPWLVEGESKGPAFPAAFPDGTSNTWLVVEAAEAVPWAKPDDLPYDGVLPLPKLGGPGGVYVAGFGDGSVRTFRRGQIDEQNMRFLISVADGNVVNIPGR
ncbi:MAG: hypothetical protein JWO38_2660 [Gemmataceae bacterium]|nr:hypothetical protein [Gemmataceae bacterium]